MNRSWRSGWPVGGEYEREEEKKTYAILRLFGVDSSSELASARLFLGETFREA